MADSVNGDDTELLLTGVLTVTPASAGIARVTIIEETKESLTASFIENPL
jgi:hypothetical protein